MDAVNPGFYVALYSSPDSFEMFFLLCYVIDVGAAPEMMVDDYNHTTEKGSMYLKCNYLEKIWTKGNVFYKMLKKIAYVLPAQVVNSFISLNDDLFISAADYQWLAYSI